MIVQIEVGSSTILITAAEPVKLGFPILKIPMPSDDRGGYTPDPLYQGYLRWSCTCQVGLPRWRSSANFPMIMQLAVGCGWFAVAFNLRTRAFISS